MLILANSRISLAHEYWIDPVGDQWETGDVLSADIRNGDHFIGTDFPFDTSTLSRAGLIAPSERRALTGTLGNYPAISLIVSEPGLHLLLLETTRRQHTYDNFDAFTAFLDYHGLSEFQKRHKERNLPDQAIQENYYRFCKAFVVVDNPRQFNHTPLRYAVQTLPALQPQNQRLELLALGNPIGTNSLSVQVRFEGKPLPDRQIELFHRNEQDSVMRTTAVSNDEGWVEFDISSKGDYLINSVWILDSLNEHAHWTTLWASLFFQQPL